MISWDINLQWQIETDPERASEIEVRSAVGSPDGWDGGLRRFAAHVAV